MLNMKEVMAKLTKTLATIPSMKGGGRTIRADLNDEGLCLYSRPSASSPHEDLYLINTIGDVKLVSGFREPTEEFGAKLCRVFLEHIAQIITQLRYLGFGAPLATKVFGLIEKSFNAGDELAVTTLKLSNFSSGFDPASASELASLLSGDLVQDESTHNPADILISYTVTADSLEDTEVNIILLTNSFISEEWLSLYSQECADYEVSCTIENEPRAPTHSLF